MVRQITIGRREDLRGIVIVISLFTFMILQLPQRHIRFDEAKSSNPPCSTSSLHAERLASKLRVGNPCNHEPWSQNGKPDSILDNVFPIIHDYSLDMRAGVHELNDIRCSTTRESHYKGTLRGARSARSMTFNFESEQA